MDWGHEEQVFSVHLRQGACHHREAQQEGYKESVQRSTTKHPSYSTLSSHLDWILSTPTFPLQSLCMLISTTPCLISSKTLKNQVIPLVLFCSVFRFSFTGMGKSIIHLIVSGFEVVNKGCCGTGLIEVSVLCDQLNPFTCNDATKYVFWDSYHPTERAYKTIIGEIFQGYVDSFF